MRKEDIKGSKRKTFSPPKPPSGSIVDFSSSKSKRDSRRTFTATQKKEILYQQNGKCADAHCGHKILDPRAIHFHHGKAWAYGGRTIVANGRALCPECHEIATHEERLKRLE